MSDLSDKPASLIELVTFLTSQRKNILKNWHIACSQDPLLNPVADLSQVDFNNAISRFLAILHQRLLGQVEEGNMAQLAIAHGLQRRPRTHLMVETVQELNHLIQALFNELSYFQELAPQTDPKLFWLVQQHITQIMAEIIQGSIKIYDELQRSETAIQQEALDQMKVLSKERSDRLRTSMHDLGSSFSIISGAASLLQVESISEEERTVFLGMLNRNITSAQAMIANLMDLSRLEGGHETLHIQPVDAAQLVTEISRSVQPMAEKRELVVRTDGPDSLLVETDAVKLQRIIQNLLLNALKYTSTGFIDISWAEQDTNQWLLRIQDSGPGLPVQLVTQLTGQAKPGVTESTPLVTGTSKGEGVGLRIVKEFSQLLSARLEGEAAQGQGTAFLIWLPIRYPV